MAIKLIILSESKEDRDKITSLLKKHFADSVCIDETQTDFTVSDNVFNKGLTRRQYYTLKQSDAVELVPMIMLLLETNGYKDIQKTDAHYTGELPHQYVMRVRTKEIC